MQTPAIPSDESARISVLNSLNVLDTPPEELFDRLTRVATRLFNVPIALVSLIDSNRQWFKSSSGLSVCDTSRDISFCAHAILNDDIMYVENALKDERFFDNPLVTGEPWIRFYAGCPLRVNNYKMGTFCLIDKKPRPFNEEDRQLLRDLAGMAEQDLAASRLATTDELTELLNRRGFENYSRQALSFCRRLKRPATLVFLDLNGFKQINDQFGHAEGDMILKAFAEGLRSVFRESDVIARFGGDEFAALLTDTKQAMAELALSRLRDWVGRKNRKELHKHQMQFSAGTIEFDPKRHPSIEDLLAEADADMYREKTGARKKRPTA
jgi:diguanylate cyclase (GGDEF)-like protein